MVLSMPAVALDVRQPGVTYVMPPPFDYASGAPAPAIDPGPPWYLSGPVRIIPKALVGYKPSTVLARVASRLDKLVEEPPPLEVDDVVMTGVAAEEDPLDAPVATLFECVLTQKAIYFLRLEKTAYRSLGVVLPKTTAYASSCDVCKGRNLECRGEVQLTEGNCLCGWRTDGFDPVLRPVTCGRCVEDCVGRFETFDVGSPFTPAKQVGGMCIRKKPLFDL